MMNAEQYWKNFSLGDELQIAGRFLYNGLRAFHDMDLLTYEDEIFEVLYNLSVGMERLLKIAVILIEHDPALDQEAFEKSLITHNHHNLCIRVTAKHPLKIAGVHNDFLQLLSTFYKSHRYGRYAISVLRATHDEKQAFLAFFEKHLTVSFPREDGINVARNAVRLKKFLGKTVGKIATQLYRVIDKEATRLRLYTYELRADSKAAMLFLAERFDFLDEDVFVKELLLHFVHCKARTGHIGYMHQLMPLKFDPGAADEHIQCLLAYEKRSAGMDSIEALYDDIEDKGARLEAMAPIGEPHVYFDGDEDDEENEEDDESR